MKHKKQQALLRYNRRRWISRKYPIERKNGKAAYVYLFRHAETEFYKIGFSGNWMARLEDLQASNPFLTYYIAVRVKDATKAESTLHKRFKNKRFNREFFKLSDGEIRFIKEYLASQQPVGYSPKSEDNHEHKIDVKDMG